MIARVDKKRKAHLKHEVTEEQKHENISELSSLLPEARIINSLEVEIGLRFTFSPCPGRDVIGIRDVCNRD
jgi:hypothetical protein